MAGRTSGSRRVSPDARPATLSIVRYVLAGVIAGHGSARPVGYVAPLLQWPEPAVAQYWLRKVIANPSGGLPPESSRIRQRSSVLARLGHIHPRCFGRAQWWLTDSPEWYTQSPPLWGHVEFISNASTLKRANAHGSHQPQHFDASRERCSGASN